MKRTALAVLVVALLAGAGCRESRMECTWRDPKTGTCRAWVAK